MIVFDIETGPLKAETVLSLSEPFKEPAHPGEFNPASVKTGNLKDQAKIDAKIAEARAAHEQAVASHSVNVELAKSQWAQQAMDRAALDPITGQVLAIGYMNDCNKVIDSDPSEAVLIDRFWRKIEKVAAAKRSIVGHNILKFDLPFLVRRSWILDVRIPEFVFAGQRISDQIFTDTMKVWSCGEYGSFVGLDCLAKALGVGEKLPDVSGADFARLWNGTPEERETAKWYLATDLQLTWDVAVQIGIV
jgi:DNA polymerase elongation subunit (family B)